MKIWAIINVTPDSFFSASRVSKEQALVKFEEFISAGADVVDIGAESTRPGSTELTWQEEWKRLNPVLEQLISQFGQNTIAEKVSIDTRNYEVMKRCLDNGVKIINDVSGGAKEIYSMIAGYGAKYVLMHMQGSPQTMQENPQYANVVQEVKSWLHNKTESLIQAGVAKENILWDPGIGFGKTTEHNIELIKAVPSFLEEGYELLYGISRKRLFQDILGQGLVEERYIPSIIGQTILAAKGVQNLRVHDVEEMVWAKTLLEQFS